MSEEQTPRPHSSQNPEAKHQERLGDVWLALAKLDNIVQETEQSDYIDQQELVAVEALHRVESQIVGLFEQLESALRENGRLAVEAATADQDWKRAEAEVEKLTHALTQVRAECDLPDYIAEFVGEALTLSDHNVRKSWGPERMRHDPERT